MASSFVSISGVSDVFNGSLVTYSNQIKNSWLKVDEKILEDYGAVSKECVSSMLDGIRLMAKSDYAVAISGIAGPNGGTAQKPVGTVYIGILSPYSREIFACLFDGDRKDIQLQSVKFTIEKLSKTIK